MFNFIFEQNYPNPVDLMTTFKFTNPIEAFIKLQIFDLYGNKIATLVDNKMNEGNFTVTWECKYETGEKLPSGIYFAKLSIGAESKIIKLIVR